MRAVARYADACNIFGDAETIRHKMKILDEHCATEGRDPREITRTALKTLIIGRDPVEAARKAEPLRAAYGDRFNLFGMAGDPDAVRAAIPASTT